MHRLSRNSTARRTTARRHWRHELVELAGVFVAVAAADLAANLVGHGPDGPLTLACSATVLLAAVGFHTWWARRHGHSPPGSPGPDATRPPQTAPAGETDGPEPDAVPGELTLWRLRTTVEDAPGSLAALCGALARQRVDILTLQTHPLSDGTVDEFLVRAPAQLAPQALSRAVATAGGRDTWLERADAHDLVDTPTRVLNLAARAVQDSAELPVAVRQLLGRSTIRSVPAGKGEQPPEEGVLEECTMRLRDPSGGTLVVERPYLPFTPTEFARARALVSLEARLGPRVPPHRAVVTLPEGNELTVRRAGPADLAAALAMHERCSPATLRSRYHGPVREAGRYLEHLLSPRHGRTLAVQTASGRLVALGHLLWDGEESEIALLVEDDWQGRGIGAMLLRKLVGLARQSRCGAVYAVTQSANTAMLSAMRGLGVPLDYQLEDATLVITATLDTARQAPEGTQEVPQEAAQEN